MQGEDDGFGMIPGDLEEILIPVPSPATDRAPEVEDKTLADNSVAPESLEAQVTETVVMNGSLDQDDQEESGLSTAGTIDLGSTVADQLVQTLKAANGPPDAVFIADLSANADVATDGNSALDQGGQGDVPVLSGLYFEREGFSGFLSGHGVSEFGVGDVLKGSGSSFGELLNRGTLSPGNSPGVIHHTGDFTQTGILEIELGGLHPADQSPFGDGYDQLNVSGQLTLDGRLEVSLINGFVPSEGDVFQILSFDALSGDFSEFDGLDIGGGLFLRPEITDSGYTLTAVRPVVVSLQEGTLRIDATGMRNLDLTISVGSEKSGILISDRSLPVVVSEGLTGWRDGFQSVTVAGGGYEFLEVNGSAGDDTLTVDFGSGDPIPAGGLVYHGGAQQTRTGDQLVIQGGSFETSRYEVDNATDGSIELDGTRIVYTGLEPIVDNSSVSDRVFGLSTSDDFDASLTSDAEGNLTLAGSTFESITFLVPSNSLTIRGLAGNDTLTLGTLDLGATDLTVEVEIIVVPAGVTVSGSGDVTFNSVSADLSQITSVVGLPARSARVSVLGGISTTGSITLHAEVIRDILVSGASNSTLTLESASLAAVEIGSGAVLIGASVVLDAVTRGDVDLENSGGPAVNKISDTATVKVGTATITAGSVSIRALRETQYRVAGTDARNQVSGDTEAVVTAGTISAAAGGALVSASDLIEMSAVSAGLNLNLGALSSSAIGMASARNWFSGNALAQITGSTVHVLGGGNLDLFAERDLQVVGRTETITLTGTLPAGASINLTGVYASNTVLGSTRAIIEGGTVTTEGSGDVRVRAIDRSAIDSRTGITAAGGTGLTGANATIGPAIAFNAIGWDPGDFAHSALDALLGTSFGTEVPAATTAFIRDGAVTAGRDLSVSATSETQLNATVSNAVESSTSGLFGATGMSVGGVLASNFVSSRVRAFIEFTSGSGGVDAGGDLDVSALDTSGVFSNAKLLSSAMTSTDGGRTVLDQLSGSTVPADFFSGSGSTEIAFGQTVRLADDHASGGVGGLVYRYLGELHVLDLSGQDYSDQDFWLEVSDTTVIPDGISFNSANSVSVGGVVVRNDVRSEVEGFIRNADVRALGLSVEAIESATIHAVVDSTAIAAGASAFGAGTSLAINGTIATNLVLSSALATVVGSTLTVEQRAVRVQAENGSIINADTQSVLSGDANSVGAMLAFNTVGWKSQNVLFQAIDALLGTSIGDEQPATVTATIIDTALNLGGDLSVTADSAAQIQSSVGTSATASVSSLFNPSGIGVSAVLASNLVSSSSEAFIDYAGDRGAVAVGGALLVHATDDAGIDSESRVKAVSSTTNAGVGSLVGRLIDSMAEEIKFSSKSGSRSIKKYDRVRVASDHSAGGVTGATYLYIGADAGWDLGTQNYTNTLRWKRVIGTNAENLLVSFANFTPSVSVGVGGLVVRNDVRSEVNSNIDNATVTVGGGLQVLADQSALISASDESVSSATGPSSFGAGVSLAVNATIVTNLVLSTAEATITGSDVTANGTAAVVVESSNESGIDARITSSTSSGGQAVGVTLAFNTIGWQAQNILFAAIDALIGTDIGTEQPALVTATIENTRLVVGGDLMVRALGSEQVNATVSNAADSVASALFGASGAAASAVLASNMVSSRVDAHIDYASETQGVVQAGGDLSVIADDSSGVYSNVKLVASSVTSSDGGVNVLKNALTDYEDVDFYSEDGLQTIGFGSRIRVAEDHDLGGEPGDTYRYMGEDGPVDLASQDYSDIGFWYAETPTDVVPQINLTSSDAIAIGGLVVRNDVRSQVEGFVRNAALTAGSVEVDGFESAVIKATADSTAESSGGSAFGDGTDLAVNATIATNLILSDGRALIQDSEVTTTAGDVVVNGRNSSVINAKTLNSTTSGGTGVTVTLAFNTIGWKAQNILYQAIDALLGDSLLGDEDPALVSGAIVDTPVSSAGGVSVLAESEAVIRAKISNTTDSVSASLQGASGLAVGVVLASNLVSTQTRATVESGGNVLPLTALGSGVTVFAQDRNSILAVSDLVSTASASSADVLGTGVSLIKNAVQAERGLDYTDRSGVRDLKTGDIVLLDSHEYTTFDLPELVGAGDRILLEHTESGGTAGDVYEFVGSEALVSPDFGEQDFSDTALWKRVTGTAGESYTFLGADQAGVDLALEDYSDSSRWQDDSGIDVSEYLPGLGLLSSSASAFGGLIVRNDVRSSVLSHVREIDLTAAGDVVVQASQTPNILAKDSSVVEASAGSVLTGGSATAVNAVIATNLVLSSADALITNGSVITGNEGDFVLESSNSARIVAVVTSSVSGDTAIGIVLAFNTIGWNAQNFLFNTVDALFGTSIGSENTSRVLAAADGTSIETAGGISVLAESTADIRAHIENAATAIGVGLGGSDSITVAPVIAMNKVSTDVRATVVNGAVVRAGNGDIAVGGTDASSINAKVSATALSVAAGVKSSKGISVGFSAARNEIRSDVEAFIRNSGSAAAPVEALNGRVLVTVEREAEIISTGTATAVAVAASAQGGLAVSGGGTIAFNFILGGANASVETSHVRASGDVIITSNNRSLIDAFLSAVAAAVGAGGKSTPAVAIGISVARNQIGWREKEVEANHVSASAPTRVVAGDLVLINEGPQTGEVYEYIGELLEDEEGISLSAQNYGDRSAWKQANLEGSAAQVQAFSLGSGIDSGGDLVVTASSAGSIKATVVAAAAAVAASGQSGVAVSAAGVYVENRIKTDVKAYIDGDRVGGVNAQTVSVSADEAAGISVIAGAASLAASLAGQTGVSVSIGLSLAFNEITGDVEAFVRNASHGVTTRSGDVQVTAVSRNQPLFDTSLSALGITPDQLDNAGTQDGDDEETSADEAALDKTRDDRVREALTGALVAGGETFSLVDTIAAEWIYRTSEGIQEVAEDHLIRLSNDYQNGGAGGRSYRFLGDEETIELGEEDYSDTTRWEIVDPDVKVSVLEEGRLWMLVNGRGLTYILRADGDVLSFSRATISAVAVAASAGVAIAGSTGIAISGGGAVAINNVIRKTNAFVEESDVTSAADVILTATDDSEITAIVAAVSVAAGVGGSTGVGVSIGIAVARNFIGFDATGNEAGGEVRAYLLDSSVDAGGDLNLTASSNQLIDAVVLAGSAAIAAGGSTGVAVSGSGVYAENQIGVDVETSIDGDGATGIRAASVSLLTIDGSSIVSIAGAASVAASFGGSAGVAVSIGVALARNAISNAIDAVIRNADQGVTTTVGNVQLVARQKARIDGIAAAAALAAGFGGSAGVAVAGAGAEAKNVILGGSNAYVDGSVVQSAGDVRLEAENESRIDAINASASVAAGAGGSAGVGVSIGLAIARNFVGYKPDFAATYDLTTDDDPANVTKGQRVKILNGVRAGDVYEFIGDETLTPEETTEEGTFLNTQDYADQSLWKLISISAEGTPVQASIRNSSVHALGVLSATATSTQVIDSIVVAGSVAIGAGGAAGVALSGAGVSVENRIQVDVKAFIEGDRNGGIRAQAIDLSAADASGISAIAGAASVAAGVGGAAGVAVSIGIALAYNEIGNHVAAYISDASNVAATIGDITINAQSRGEDIFNFTGVTRDQLDDASVADDDDSETGLDEAAVDLEDDKAVLNGVRVAFDANGIELSEAVRLCKVIDGREWILVTEAGRTYYIELQGIEFHVFRTSISAYSVAASVGAAIGGAAGVSVSGAGAYARNVILTETNASIENSSVQTAGDVLLSANNTAEIAAVVGAVSVSVAGGGAAGVGVSIGVSISKNFIGYNLDGEQASSGVRAYVLDSSITAGGELRQTAIGNQRIGAFVLAGSGAIAAGGAAGVAASGSGVDVENRIGVEVQAFIDGDGTMGIQAQRVVLVSDDTSTIAATALAISLAAGFGGAAGVSLSVGVTLASNTITSRIESFIRNANTGVVTTIGDIVLDADEKATIAVVAAAASASLAGGLVGVALSGAGAQATNIILSSTSAFVDASKLLSIDDVIITADNQSTIDAVIATASIAAAGGAVGVGASIGVALARNYIGMVDDAATSYDYTTAHEPGSVHQGKRVKILGGVRGGDVYEYIGSETLLASDFEDDEREASWLIEQDYSDRDHWKQVNLGLSGSPIMAYIRNSEVVAAGDLTVGAVSDQSIHANTLSGSVAIAGGAIGVALAGAGVSAENQIAAVVKAFIEGSAGEGVLTGGNITVFADDTSVIESETLAVSVAASFGAIGASVAISVSVAYNTIANSVNAYVAGATIRSDGEVMTVESKEEAVIDSSATATAVSASFSLGVSLAGGGAVTGTTLNTETRSWIDQSTIHLTNDLLVHAMSHSVATPVVSATAASFGLIAAAVAGTVSSVEVAPVLEAFINASVVTADDIKVSTGGGLLAAPETSGLSVSTGISVGASVATVKGVFSILAGLKDGNVIAARSLTIQPYGEGRFYSKTEASSAGLLAGIAGSVSTIEAEVISSAILGDNNTVHVQTLQMTANQTQDLDSKSDSLALGLVAGTGAYVSTATRSRSVVDVGRNSTVTADTILLNSFLDLNKSLFSDQENGEGANLSSGSAGLASLSSLTSTTSIGSGSRPLGSEVNIGEGTVMKAKKVFDIETLVKTYAKDSVQIEGVSGFGISLGDSQITATTLSQVNVKGATLENTEGEIYLTTRSDSRLNPSANLFTATAIGGAGADATGTLTASQVIRLEDATIKAADVYLLAGQSKKPRVPNLLGGSARTDITAFSFAGISVQDPTFNLVENNRIDVLGNSRIQSLSDVRLITHEGIHTAKESGMSLNISLIPYGTDIDNDIDGVTNNTVNIGENARIEAAINNITEYRILPMTVSGVQQLDPSRIGTLLSAEEKVALGLSADVRYQYATLELDLTGDSAGTLEATLANKFYVIRPVGAGSPVISYVNLTSVLSEQKAKIEGWIVSHGNNAEAVVRYQAQLDEVILAMQELGLIDNSANPDVKVEKKGLDVLFVRTPKITAIPGSVFIEADSTPVSEISPLIGSQVTARAGARINILNKTPFTMEVDDAVVEDNRTTTLVDGELISLEPGNVYLNNQRLTNVLDDQPKTITITQDSLTFAAYGVDLQAPGGVPQDIYVTGMVRNENGPISVVNQKGGINVTGQLLGESLDIQAAGNFSLNVDDWFHLADPRQYVDYTNFRNQVRTESGVQNLVTFNSLDQVPGIRDSINGGLSRIVTRGRVNITARYLNIDGLIQSGVDSVTLNIANTFNPGRTSTFINDEGNLLNGLSFGSGGVTALTQAEKDLFEQSGLDVANDGQTLSGYFDAVNGQIVIDDFVAQAGRITLTGQMLSTGNGKLVVADGNPHVEINNESPFALVLGVMDLDSGQSGQISITDSVTLQKIVYSIKDETITEQRS